MFYQKSNLYLSFSVVLLHFNVEIWFYNFITKTNHSTQPNTRWKFLCQKYSFHPVKLYWGLPWCNNSDFDQKSCACLRLLLITSWHMDHFPRLRELTLSSLSTKFKNKIQFLQRVCFNLQFPFLIYSTFFVVFCCWSCSQRTSCFSYFFIKSANNFHNSVYCQLIMDRPRSPTGTWQSPSMSSVWAKTPDREPYSLSSQTMRYVWNCYGSAILKMHSSRGQHYAASSDNE